MSGEEPTKSDHQAQWRAFRFVSEERGATMVDYGMIVALIAIMVMGALYMLGGSVAVKLNQIATCLTTRVC